MMHDQLAYSSKVKHCFFCLICTLTCVVITYVINREKRNEKKKKKIYMQLMDAV